MDNSSSAYQRGRITPPYSSLPHPIGQDACVLLSAAPHGGCLSTPNVPGSKICSIYSNRRKLADKGKVPGDTDSRTHRSTSPFLRLCRQPTSGTMANPNQYFLLADHIKLSLLERQRAISLNLEPTSQDGHISRSLDSLKEGVENVTKERVRLQEAGDTM